MEGVWVDKNGHCTLNKNHWRSSQKMSGWAILFMITIESFLLESIQLLGWIEKILDGRSVNPTIEYHHLMDKANPWSWCCKRNSLSYEGIFMIFHSINLSGECRKREKSSVAQCSTGWFKKYFLECAYASQTCLMAIIHIHLRFPYSYAVKTNPRCTFRSIILLLLRKTCKGVWFLLYFAA